MAERAKEFIDKIIEGKQKTGIKIDVVEG